MSNYEQYFEIVGNTALCTICKAEITVHSTGNFSRHLKEKKRCIQKQEEQNIQIVEKTPDQTKRNSEKRKLSLDRSTDGGNIDKSQKMSVIVHSYDSDQDDFHGTAYDPPTRKENSCREKKKRKLTATPTAPEVPNTRGRKEKEKSVEKTNDDLQLLADIKKGNIKKEFGNGDNCKAGTSKGPTQSKTRKAKVENTEYWEQKLQKYDILMEVCRWNEKKIDRELKGVRKEKAVLDEKVKYAKSCM